MTDDSAQSTVVDAEPAHRVGGTQPVSRAERARRTAYRSRFAVVYVLLAAVVGVAVGSFIVLASRDDPPPPAKWSDWQPTGSPEARLKQIADRVSRRYRLRSGNELAAALVSTPQVTSPDQSGSRTVSVPVSAIAVRPDTSRGQAEETDIDFVPANGSIYFILCGLGDRCSINEGSASTARHELLRREALELSLYTFKYVDGIDSITVFLPPNPSPQGTPTAVFLKRSDLKNQLKTPLSRTLGPTTPGIGEMPQHELTAVNDITLPRLYAYDYTQAQDGSAILVLAPVPLGS
jgi:hypothetical protein